MSPIRLGTPEGSSADGAPDTSSMGSAEAGAQRLEGVCPSSPELPAVRACAHSPHAVPASPLGHSYLDTIEQAVSEGQTLLIEDVGETVEPVLDHLLGRNTTKKGRSVHPVLWCRGASPALSNHCCPKMPIYAPLHDSSHGLILPHAHESLWPYPLVFSGYFPVGTLVVAVTFWTVLVCRVQFI